MYIWHTPKSVDIIIVVGKISELLSLFHLQSISAPGSGIWSDGRDKNDGTQTHTWNVEVLIDVLKELVS